MTNIKKNDFGEGFIESDEGYKVTFKTLVDGHTANFDTDVKTGLKSQKKLLELSTKSVFLEKWLMPNEDEGRKYGKFAPLESDRVAVTIKDIESKTYIHLNIDNGSMVAFFKENGLKPKWTKYDVTAKRYVKVSA